MLSGKAKPINEQLISVQGHRVDGRYHNLPEKRVLYLYHHQSVTFLKVFFVDNLNTPLKECSMVGEYAKAKYKFLGTFPNGNILLQEEMRGFDTPRALITICPDTLKTLSIQAESLSDVGFIDNKCFFTIKENKDTSKHELILYKWDKDKNIYAITNTVCPFEGCLNLADSAYDILFLGKNSSGKNRYCCQFVSNTFSAFKIVVFDIDPKNNEVEICGNVIEPTEYHGNETSCRVVGLPNGQLLTYHYGVYVREDHLQIWDTESGQCIKEWDWNIIQNPDKFNFDLCKIKSFPDSKHLLVSRENNVCLFNMDTLIAKRIDLSATSSFSDHHILINGEVLAFLDEDDNYNVFNSDSNILHISRFDLEEMIRYREEKFGKSLVPHFFSKKWQLPEEIATEILSYNKNKF